ncbi:hypothetical protein SDRG_12444 [Saprolegnia diclina VS20]|uniref:Uncharacterized protein n=1 Tax=Saprolegnia diclina (strain VS20) TaxID=1156394 RepID=T0Q8V9_SAPDV|nr:hypothetical protein SDRG_12444 [Saprolegnia diclina VS20]EQC29900.1 hypothetical protein SDRG_12444 [Saprolegnia diclina VS20]|eukprot:XP_008616739.1 hypothetical protein SDRG_12444 [Saprolegnia diclina VS20]
MARWKRPQKRPEKKKQKKKRSNGPDPKESTESDTTVSSTASTSFTASSAAPSTASPMLKTTNTTFDAHEPPVVVMDGAITSEAVEAAARVFHAMAKDCPPLLVAKNVPLAKLLADGMDGRDFGVRLVGKYDPCCNPHDPSTLVSIYVVRSLSFKHQAAVTKIVSQLDGQQTGHLETHLGANLIAGGGHAHVPDVVVLSDDGTVRMIVEFEYKHRSFRVLVDCCCGYLATYPSLRTTVAIKLFGAQGGDPFRFGAIALQYKRDADGQPHLMYAASIGTAPLTLIAQRHIRCKIGDEAFAAMGHFEDGVANETALQHATWAHPTMDCPQLSIEVSDLEYSDVHDLLAGAPPTNERLVIDLYKVILACYRISDEGQRRHRGRG